MVEFALALPILLLLTLGTLQGALVMVGKIVVNQAAFAAARAELVGEDPWRAAAVACSPAAGTRADDPDGRFPYRLPLPSGDREIPRSRLSQEKTEVYVKVPSDAKASYVRVDVAHDFELYFPIVDLLMATPGAEHGGTPHLRIEETCTIAKPWN